MKRIKAILIALIAGVIGFLLGFLLGRATVGRRTRTVFVSKQNIVALSLISAVMVVAAFITGFYYAQQGLAQLQGEQPTKKKAQKPFDVQLLPPATPRDQDGRYIWPYGQMEGTAPEAGVGKTGK
jgi:hypothetical protein